MAGRLKRRTLRKHRAEGAAGHHHCVYVVLLDSAVGKLRKVRAAHGALAPFVGVVLTALDELLHDNPLGSLHESGIMGSEIRFANGKAYERLGHCIILGGAQSFRLFAIASAEAPFLRTAVCR